MTHCLFLCLADPQPGSDFKAQWRLYASPQECIVRSGGEMSLEEIAAAVPTREHAYYKIIVLLQGQNVLISEAKVGQQHTRYLHNAVADAMEEQLAEPLESVHIAVGEPVDAEDAAGTKIYAAAIIDVALMDRLTKALTAVGLVPDVMTVESLLLPYGAHKAYLIVHDHHVLFRFSRSLASRVEKDMFLMVFENHLRSLARAVPGSDAPSLRTVEVMLSDSQNSETQRAFIENLRAVCATHRLALEVRPPCRDLVDWLCLQWLEGEPAGAINLLQGNYKSRSYLYSLVVQWKVIVLIFIVWMAVQMAFDIALTHYLSFRAASMGAQSEDIYHDLFPKDNRIISLKAQMIQHMENTPAASEGELLDFLYVLAQNPDLSHRLTISSIVYDAKKHELSANVTTDDFSVFDQYKQQKINPGIAIEFNSAVQDKNEVHAKIRIWKPHH